VENDDQDELMHKYIEGETIGEADLKAALRRATLKMKVFPVICGTAFKNKGVQPLLDAVIDYLPSPLDVPPVKGKDPENGEKIERPADDNAPFAALAFKIMSDPFVGQLTFIRVYSGHLKTGDSVCISGRSRTERIGRLLKMHANKREDITEIYAGDICACVGLKNITTGDTICDEDHPIMREFNVQANVGKPQVAYRETIRKASQAEGKYIRQTGGSGQYGHVRIRLEPNEAGKGYEFVNEVVGGVIPREYIKPVDQGIKEAMEGGVLAGYEMVDVKATLYDGSYHEVDSNEMAFKIAGSMAFKEAARRASPVLLEPVMSVEVVVPEEYMGVIIGDLNSRRGRIEGIEHRAGSQVIKAMVPLAEMFGYATNMRSSTQGRATFSMHFSRYEEAPRSVAEEIVAKVQGRSPAGTK